MADITEVNANIDLMQLRYFVAVVDAGSISKASRLCNIAQPALSKRIANLEFAMRVPLLHRGHTGIRATEQGLLLYQAAQRVLHDMAKVIDQVHSAEDNPVGEVRVGCVNSLTRMIGPALARRVREAYPNVRLSFVAGQSGDLYRALCDGLLDLGLLVHDKEIGSLDIDLLLTEELFLVASPDLPGLPPEDVIAPEQLSGLPFVFPTARSFASGRYLLEYLRHRGIHLNIQAEIDGEAIRDLIAGSFGACILPASFVESDIASGRVCLKRLRDLPLRRDLALCSANDRPRTLAARVLARELKQMLTEELMRTAWRHVRIAG
ncbi:MAG: hypothetical protein ABT10_26225 [Novosphingobium sp. SCN 63-17]|uniref:LysR family transcriptional regulator n=2 Tax=Novosphingobium TaxID=165696 RepID=UPI00086EFF04|nr:LysR family transcriptional regulator [Novosphingobium sp. 1748]ODU76612.1 MAG: hypothetical protein ABT10_26225 [Novosphingobium sp. SCN 63-17]OJX97234.1 MAG: hypothetical protein BGP00_04575 [Novosphingobium sp. 63-713]